MDRKAEPIKPEECDSDYDDEIDDMRDIRVHNIMDTEQNLVDDKADDEGAKLLDNDNNAPLDDEEPDKPVNDIELKKDKSKPEIVDKMMPGEDPERRMRNPMDPQCQKYLDYDIGRVK